MNGKTYRLWDWNRKYDEKGKRHKLGKPRELHIENGLDVINPSAQYGLEFINKIKKAPNTFVPRKGVKMHSFSSNAYYQTNFIEVKRNTSFSLELNHGYGILLNVSGNCSVKNIHNNVIKLIKGQPAMIPATANKLHFECMEQSSFALILPDQCELSIY